MQLVGKRLACLTLLLLAAGGEGTAAAQGQPADVVADRFWASGKLDDGEKALSERLQRGEDDQVRFALGVTQFLRGVERLMQNLHSYGLKSQGGGGMIDLPVLRLPTPPNPDPKTLAYADARAVLEQWVTDLNAAEQTLARVKSADVKLPVRVGMIRLDFDGDGQAGDEETLWRIFARVQPRAGVNEANAAEFAIAFDAGDVAWLRGYCHLLAALGEVALAHDGQELFESTAHMFFQKVRSPHAYLQEGRKLADFGGDIDVADLIALVHLIRMPVTEPQRMQAALSHFQSVVAMSRASWKHILAETDNDREWVPNPAQKSVMSGLRVSQDMVDSWKTFLEECDDLLAGKRLAPFWRSNDRRGINIRRVFTEPTRLDLVLWVQGTAATPYLEEGELTRREVWNGIARAFGGDFLGFALWFN
jgi:hypothetical protein